VLWLLLWMLPVLWLLAPAIVVAIIRTLQNSSEVIFSEK
jgi:hypothetical protein